MFHMWFGEPQHRYSHSFPRFLKGIRPHWPFLKMLECVQPCFLGWHQGAYISIYIILIYNIIYYILYWYISALVGIVPFGPYTHAKNVIRWRAVQFQRSKCRSTARKQNRSFCFYSKS
jgi:hypothetical protein